MSETVEQVQAIGEVRWRQIVELTGRVRDLRVRPTPEGTSSLECTLVDATGGITLIFMGRRQIGGVALGIQMRVRGMVSENRSRLVILNPTYELTG
jgi:hypothetical protein